MTQETWNAFLKTMNNDPNTIVLDLTKKESTEKEKLVNSVKNFESTTQVFYEDINSNQYQRDDQLFQQQEWNNETAEGRLLNSIFSYDNLNGYEREDS